MDKVKQNEIFLYTISKTNAVLMMDIAFIHTLAYCKYIKKAIYYS